MCSAQMHFQHLLVVESRVFKHIVHFKQGYHAIYNKSNNFVLYINTFNNKLTLKTGYCSGFRAITSPEIEVPRFPIVL